MDDLWNITSGIELEGATLQLTIPHLAGDRKAVLAASGLLKIGNLARILISLQFPTDGESIAAIRTGLAGALLISRYQMLCLPVSRLVSIYLRLPHWTRPPDLILTVSEVGR